MTADKVKAKIQELCPDLMAVHECSCPSEEDIVGYPITLAVVLRAIGTTKRGGLQPGITIDSMGYFRVHGTGFTNQSWIAHWNLEKDNYDDQSDETQAFIGSLLGV